MNEFNFSRFPQLETERLILREIKPIDTAALFELYRREEIMRYRGADTFQSTGEALALIQSFKKKYLNREGIRWGLSLKGKEKDLLGTVGMNSILWQHYRADIGYELHPDYWNRGLMTETLKAVTGFCLTKAGLQSLEANIAPDNQASARVLVKTGFEKEAHYKENYYYKGWWDSVIYSLHRS